MGECNHLDANLLTRFVVDRFTFDAQQLRQHGSDHFDLTDLLSTLRQVVELSGGPVEVPLAGRGESFEKVP